MYSSSFEKKKAYQSIYLQSTSVESHHGQCGRNVRRNISFNPTSTGTPAAPSTHPLHQHPFLLTGQLCDCCESMALWATPELLSSSRSSWLAQVNGQLVGLREEGCQAPSGSLHLMAKLSLFTTRAHFSTTASTNRINLWCFCCNRSCSGGFLLLRGKGLFMVCFWFGHTHKVWLIVDIRIYFDCIQCFTHKVKEYSLKPCDRCYFYFQVLRSEQTIKFILKLNSFACQWDLYPVKDFLLRCLRM